LSGGPYSKGGYFYYYQHRDSRWIYSRDKAGPWKELPRDRHPKEIRYKDYDRDRDRNR
jgi:hypothetical protein